MSTGISWGTESSQELLLTQPFQLGVSVSLRIDGKSAAAHCQSTVGGGALPNVGVCSLATDPQCRKKGNLQDFPGDDCGAIRHGGCLISDTRDPAVSAPCAEGPNFHLGGCSDSSNALPHQGLSWVRPSLPLEVPWGSGRTRTQNNVVQNNGPTEQCLRYTLHKLIPTAENILRFKKSIFLEQKKSGMVKIIESMVVGRGLIINT